MKYRSTLNKVLSKVQILPLNSLNTVVKYLTNNHEYDQKTPTSHILLPIKQMRVIFRVRVG